MQNNTIIDTITILINKKPEQHIYTFPNVNARYMIDFDRIYTNNMHNDILVLARHDVKDYNNNRTYYLYEKDYKIYEVYVIIVNGIVKTYAQPYKMQISTIR